MQQQLCLVHERVNHTNMVIELSQIGKQTSESHFTVVEVERKMKLIRLYIPENPKGFVQVRIFDLGPVFYGNTLQHLLGVWHDFMTLATIFSQ